jgi:hypothetical protein
MSESISSVSNTDSSSKLSKQNQQVSSVVKTNPKAFQLMVEEFMNNAVSALTKESSANSGNNTAGLNTSLNSLIGLGTNTSSGATSGSGLSATDQLALGTTKYDPQTVKVLGAQYLNNAISFLNTSSSDLDSNNGVGNNSGLDINSMLGTSSNTFGSSSILETQLQQLRKLQSLDTYANLVNSKDPTAASYIDPKTGQAAVGIIEEVKVGENSDVTFVINGGDVPLSAVKSITRYNEGNAEV